MATPLVSVLLPVRNGGARLAAALDSLARQTFTQAELVVVNDGSTDDTAGVLARHPFAARQTVITLPRPAGLVAALQAGLERARGALIARMDADDDCHPERLQRQVAALTANDDLDVVASRVAFGGDPVASAGYARYVAWTNTVLTHDDISLSRFRESPLAHPSVMFRRAVLDRHGGYREGAFPEDYELWLRWLEAGVRFAKLPETLLTWNDPPGRLSRTHPNYAAESFYQLKAGYLARWLVRHNPHHPRVWIIGAGKVTRRRVEALRACGVEVAGYLDIDRRKVGQVHHGVRVLHHDDLPPPGSCFVLPYVSQPGAAEYLRDLLERRGYVRGRDFVEAA